jgi:uncharacterized protein (UPF0276 family)
VNRSQSNTAPPVQPQSDPGFGLGLRTPHYADYLEHGRAAAPGVDWLEIITDNFLVEGGKPLVVLDELRRDWPMAMHGVGMSIGSAQGLDTAYVKRVKTLADRVQPLWVSDHLCFTGAAGQVLHDLYPLPYTDEAARCVIEHIGQAQEVLQRRLVIENVSSYIRYGHDTSAEWEFLSHVAQAADCELLLDVNNVYVSSVNHGFDPLHYLAALPRNRVRQMHLAGHSRRGDQIIDTHDAPVAPEVWALFEAAWARFGPVATLIERDAHIPPLSELCAELRQARQRASRIVFTPMREAADAPASLLRTPARHAMANHSANPSGLLEQQERLVRYCLSTESGPPEVAAAGEPAPDMLPTQGLLVYRHAYSARLAEVLAESFERVARYMGNDGFDEHARRFALAHPPTDRSLSRYGEDFPNFLLACHPLNPELFELAQLDWDLRTRFDAPDTPALTLESARADTAGAWLHVTPALHPNLRLRRIQTNVVALWNALSRDEEVPPPQALPEPTTLAVWRHGLQPHFRTLDAEEARFLQALQAPSNSLNAVIDAFTRSQWLQAPETLSAWLQQWWGQGWLRSANSASHA